MRHYRLPVILAAAFLTACQIDTSRYPESSPFKPIPAGATLELHQPINIPADKLAVYLQAGEIRPYANIEVLKAHCKFELYRLSDKARVVHPDRFRITRVSYEETTGVSLGWLNVAEARIGVGIHLRVGAGSDDGGSPGMISFVTQMRLQSANQPEVFRMSCGHLDDIGSNHLSIADIRKTLGNIFTLRLTDAAQ